MTHREHVLHKLGLSTDKGYSIATLARITGISAHILQEVYNRGIGAYRTQGSSVRMLGSFKKGGSAPMSQRLSKEQWAMARIYSFLDSALAGAPKKHDLDLHEKIA